MLLVLFVVAVQLGPVVHLSGHRNDHTHGAATTARAHASAHRAGVPHDHTGAEDDEERGSRQTPPQDEQPPDHGRGSSAHFDLALIDGPPPLSLPLPADHLAPRPAADPRSPRAPARHRSAVRGPPPSAVASLTYS